jgi:hypothetical protein
VLCIYFWRDSASNSAAIKITAFHFQSLFVLIRRTAMAWYENLGWDLGGKKINNFKGLILVFFQTSSSTSSFSFVAIECLVSDWDIIWTLVFILLTPLFILLLSLLSWLTSKIVSALPKIEPLDPELRKLRVIKLVVALITLCYFNIATMAFSMLSCTRYDSWTQKYFLNGYSLLWILLFLNYYYIIIIKFILKKQ